MQPSQLNVRDLAAYYRTETTPNKAVDGVTFDVARDEIFGIAGESGCGKSTLAKAILRLLKPPGYIKDGKILFNDVNLLELDEKDLRSTRWRHISYIPQGSMNSLNPVIRAEDQIIEAIRLHDSNISKSDLKQKVEELFISVGLAPEVSRAYPHELSGGMKQRVVIAMAIALGPELIVADEPTTALDVVVQKGILQLLLDLKEKLGSSLILITHSMPVQAQVSDRIAIMYAGKIVEVGDSNVIFSDPLHPYTQALISAVPSIEATKKLSGLSGFPPDLRTPPPGCRFHPRCPHAIEGKCNVKEPSLIEVLSGRLVACHMNGGNSG